MRRFVGTHGIALLLLVFFSLTASQKLFTGPFYTSHDGAGHVIRMIEFDEVLHEGQFPVRIAKRIHHGLGYPFFNFNYPLIYYLGEGFHLLGLPFVSVFKLLMFLSVAIGAFSLYFFTLPYFGMLGAFTSALFFTFAPYKFLNMYVRGNVAESLGLALVPLVLWAVDHFARGGRYRYALLIFTVSVLTLSHNITAAIGLVLGITFFVFQLRNVKKKSLAAKNFFFALFAALLLTAFFWVPVVLESGLTKLVELAQDYKQFFPTLGEVVYSPWGFGLYEQGVFPGKMSPQIGLIHLLVAIIAAAMYIIKVISRKAFTKKDSFVLFFLLVLVVSFFLILPVSKFLWDFLYPLQFVQLPWRFVGYVTIGTAIASGFVVSQIRSTRLQLISIVVLIALLLYANRNHIRINQYIEFENPFGTSEVYGPSTTSKDEHMPRLVPRVYQAPDPDGDLIASTSGICSNNTGIQIFCRKYRNTE
ncbi:MAG: 6-pyruvoyl-tetrahydropterin synthase-related protein [Nanoarchaeota archaeon]